MTHLKKAGSDYIPVWDGSLEEWESYVVRCGIYVRGTEPHKAPNRIANLIQHIDTLSEPWKMIMKLSEDERIPQRHSWVSSKTTNCLPTALQN
jgi:hypothetical protein